MERLLKNEVFFTPQIVEIKKYKRSLFNDIMEDSIETIGIFRKAFFSEEDMTKREMTKEDEEYDKFLFNNILNQIK